MIAKPAPAPLIVGTLSSLLIFSSLAETIVASWSLYNFNTLRNKKSIVLAGNHAYNINWSPSTWNTGSTIYDESNVIFANIWVFPNTGAEITPRAELVAGVVALSQGLIVSAYIVLQPRVTTSSSSRVFNKGTVILSALLAIVITALSGYVFAARAGNGTKLGFTGGPGWAAVGWDAWPSWEQWVCAYAAQISARPEISAAGPQWREVCSLTTAARWTLLPGWICAILTVGALLFVGIRAERRGASGEQVTSQGKELDDRSVDETREGDAEEGKE